MVTMRHSWEAEDKESEGVLLSSANRDFSAIFLIVSSLSERVAQPFQPFIKTITRSSTSRLNILTIISAA